MAKLSAKPPVVAMAQAADLFIGEIRESVAAKAASGSQRRVSVAKWTEFPAIKLWHQPGISWIAEHIYPLAAPVGGSIRPAGLAI